MLECCAARSVNLASLLRDGGRFNGRMVVDGEANSLDNSKSKQREDLKTGGKFAHIARAPVIGWS